MLKQLLAFLGEEKPNPLSQDDARLALAALMMRAAKSDDIVEPAEIKTIVATLMRWYHLSETEARDLLHEASRIETEAPDTVRFTRALKEAVEFDHRIGLIECLWEVVLADGQRDPDEDALMRQVASLLGVNDRDSNIARMRVEKRRANGDTPKIGEDIARGPWS